MTGQLLTSSSVDAIAYLQQLRAVVISVILSSEAFRVGCHSSSVHGMPEAVFAVPLSFCRGDFGSTF